MLMSEDKKYKCVLCGEDSIGWGNNPEPLKEFDDGRCCDTCNSTKVIPARLVAMGHFSLIATETK